MTEMVIGSDRMDMNNKDTREQIVTAASGLFLRHGYKRTTVEDIARAVGIAKGSVYLHFDSKEAIFSAAGSRACEQMMAAAMAGAQAPGTPAQRLERFLLDVLRAVWDFWRRTPHSPVLWVEIMAAVKPHAAAAREQGRRILAELIAEGQAAGLFTHEAPADVLARLVQLAVRGFEPPFEGIDNPEQMEREFTQVVSLVLRGLQAPTTEGA